MALAIAPRQARNHTVPITNPKQKKEYTNTKKSTTNIHWEKKELMVAMEKTKYNVAHLYCNVGGTKRRVDPTLAALAPMGSRARDLLTPPEDPDTEWFVDERPSHFARMIDCLRHGTTALDFMKPYHAAIVRSLLGAPCDDDASSSMCAMDTMDAVVARNTRHASQTSKQDPPQGDDADTMSRIMRLMLDDGTTMDVARSTLCRIPPRTKSNYHLACDGPCHAQSTDSILARIASGDPKWEPPTVDGRLCIAQNARHFGLLLDCQRHGTAIIAHITSPYKLWGLRALGIYYGLDGVVDAVQIAIGCHLCKIEPSHKVEIEVMDHSTFPKTDGTEWHIKSQSGPRGKVVLASSRMKFGEIADLARAAVGAPGHVGVYADPCSGGWHLLCADDIESYGKRNFSPFTSRGYSRVYVDRYPADKNGPGPQKALRRGLPKLRYALVIVFDMTRERARNFGIFGFDVSSKTQSAGDALVRACARRDPDALAWQHVVALTRNSYDNYRAIDIHDTLSKTACCGGTIWIAHGKPGTTIYDIVRLDGDIEPL